MAAPENSPSEESPLTDLEFLDSDSSVENRGTPPSDLVEEDLEAVFQDSLNNATAEDEIVTQDLPRHPPGPGLFESICWMIGVFGAHFAGIMLFIVGSFIYLMATSSLGSTAEAIQEQLNEFYKTHALEMAGVEQGIFVLIALAAMGLRFGRGVLSKVNLQPFALSTGFLLVIAVLPLSMLSGEFYRIAFEAWSAFAERIPFLHELNQMQTMEVVKEMAANSPLWALVLVIAVCPAIGEEVIFRGVIGRGLLARWGLIPGILITSIMFGLVHMHPAHVIAVIPLGMFMHFVYYVTRSFWAPVMVHFLNNAFAVTIAKLVSESELPESAAKLSDETQAVHPMIFLPAAFFIGMLCVYLWTTRAKYVTPSGSEWTPGYLSNEQPPAGSNITLQRESASGGIIAGLALFYLMFLTMMRIFGLES